ncbi:MAG: type II toxin-antitoxin system RelE/ParE family toxin [Bacteroidia bacterium]
MSAKISWSPTARKSFDDLVSFLESKWEKKVIEKLFIELNRILNSLSDNPEMYPEVSSKRKLQKCLVRRKTLLFYRIKAKGNIELVIFADARQNPRKYKI